MPSWDLLLGDPRAPSALLTPSPPPHTPYPTRCCPACSVQDCVILNQCLAQVAESYPDTKCVKILSTGERGSGSRQGCGGVWRGGVGAAGRAGTGAHVRSPRCTPVVPSTSAAAAAAECIPGYPDANLPTVLLYRDTQCLHTLVGLRQFGGRGTSPEQVAISLNRFGEVCGDAEEHAAQVRGLVKRLVLEREEALRRQQDGEGGGAQDEDSDFE